MPKLNLESLNEERLKKSVDSGIFASGQIIHQEGRVEVVDLRDDSAQCIVQDKHPYRVELKVANKFLYLKCDCRYASRGVICEHDIAACLAIRSALEQRLPPTWRNQVNRVLDTFPSPTRKTAAVPYLLFFSLQENQSYNFPGWKIVVFQLPLGGLANRPEHFDEQNVQEFLNNNPKQASFLRNPHNILIPEECHNASPESVTLANLIIEWDRLHNFTGGIFPIDEYLTMVANLQAELYLGNSHHPLNRKIHAIPETGSLYLSLNSNPDGIRIRAKLVYADQSLELKKEFQQETIFISNAPIWLIIGDSLIKLADQSQNDLLQSFLDSAEIVIPNRDVEIFQRKYYQSLAEKLPMDGELVDWQTIESPLIRRVYLFEDESEIQAEFRLAYNEIEVAYHPSLPEQTLVHKPNTWTLWRVKRLPEEEKVAFEELISPTYGLKRAPNPVKPNRLCLRARVNPVDFLLNAVPRLIANNFEVFGEEELKTTRVNRNIPTIAFQVSSGIDWFDVKAVVNFGEIEVSLKDIRRILRKKEHFIKLQDGTIGAIPDEWLERYKHLFSLGNETDDGIRLARHHIGLLDQVLDGNQSFVSDADYLSYRQKLLNFSGIAPIPLPDNFIGTLRPYQKAGYDWLHFLHNFQFGGCLADDMGLGKTIQILVFLAGIKEGLHQNISQQAEITAPMEVQEHQTASMIVVPRSLLVNWQRESARFTPGLTILEYFSPGRQKDLGMFDQYDVVITTYGIMLRDLATLKNYPFHYIILDESQAIKNPISQTARAARMLQSRHRLVLTGTPVENSTEELWSQFAFLNPGLLGSHEYFRTEFMAPIERKGDENTTETLRKLVYPFIMRRTKDQVAPELPPRTERILYCDMEPAQRKLYLRMRDYYRGIILGMLDTEGLNGTRFRILEGLLRLRQISNHPLLVDGKFRGESGKFELLTETIQTLHAEGHKALIFSQFVQMLRIVRNRLELDNIPHLYLDGHTRNRMELVDTYQNSPDIPFFLISLRAGGQGLNLTAADYVIHIDPWWNPAVEMQASDRTHRIGQEKPIFIFKMITRDTVEEKIIQLQDRKKSLVNQLITTESSFFKSLTEEDIHNLFTD